MMFTVRRHNPKSGWKEVLCGPRDDPRWRYVSEMQNGHCPVLRFTSMDEAYSFASIYRGVAHREG